MAVNATFDQLTGLIYDAAIDPALWTYALDQVADAMHANAVSLGVYDPAHAGLPIIAPRTDPAWQLEYWEHWQHRNFLLAHSAAMPVGQLFGFETFMSRDEFDRSDFYNEWWSPQGMEVALATNVLLDGAAAGVACFCRSRKEGPFGRDEEELLRALAPHLQRAVRIHRRLVVSEARRENMAEVLNRLSQGAVLVDVQSRVMFANRSADAILCQGHGLRLHHRRLVAERAADTAALHALVAGGFAKRAGGPLALPRHERSPLVLFALPLRPEISLLPSAEPVVALLVADPEQVTVPPIPQLKALFGLTPAQAMLAREILRGEGVPGAARRLGISMATARTHLLAVFQKTGTSRQAELVAGLTHSLGGIIPPPFG